MQPGSVVAINKPRWETLRELVTRPRVTFVGEATGNTFKLQERRMTWREWWRAVWAAIS